MEKGTIVTINGDGSVSVPDKVMMQDFEVAGLFGVTIPAVRANIRTILKTGIVTGDLTNGATLVGNNILPDCYGLDMIMALAFRIHSPQAEVFRRWILEKAIKVERGIIHQPILISIDKSINYLIN